MADDQVQFLSDGARRLFEWIASPERRGQRLKFETACKALKVTDRELKAMLEELEHYQGLNCRPPIEKIEYGGMYAEYGFHVSIEANRAWAAYQDLEREHACPECGKQALEKVTVIRCRKCSYKREIR